MLMRDTIANTAFSEPLLRRQRLLPVPCPHEPASRFPASTSHTVCNPSSPCCQSSPGTSLSPRGNGRIYQSSLTTIASLCSHGIPCNCRTTTRTTSHSLPLLTRRTHRHSQLSSLSRDRMRQCRKRHCIALVTKIFHFISDSAASIASSCKASSE